MRLILLDAPDCLWQPIDASWPTRHSLCLLLTTHAFLTTFLSASRSRFHFSIFSVGMFVYVSVRLSVCLSGRLRFICLSLCIRCFSHLFSLAFSCIIYVYAPVLLWLPPCPLVIFLRMCSSLYLPQFLPFPLPLSIYPSLSLFLCLSLTLHLAPSLGHSLVPLTMSV